MLRRCFLTSNKSTSLHFLLNEIQNTTAKNDGRDQRSCLQQHACSNRKVFEAIKYRLARAYVIS